VFSGAATYIGLTVSPVKWFESLIMPWFVLAATQAAIYSRLLRGSLLEVMGEDYIRTARAKGLTERRIIWHHGVRSAITPVITVLALDIGGLLGGAVITETVFDIPGIGRLNYVAILHSDIPIVQGTVLLAAMFIVVANIAVDISYAYLDPRVQYS
jgi:peptide/nickel transport system permease protein